MTRGRRPVPPEIQALKGNPRKRAKSALVADQVAAAPHLAGPAAASAEAPAAGSPGAQPGAQGEQEILPPEGAPLAPVEFAYPEFLTGERERQIFKLIVDEFLPRNLVRTTDFNAVGRYATYMAMWIAAKQQLEESGGSNWYRVKSKHLPEGMLRRHPAFQDMLDLGHELRQAEPQLALTPLARNAIMQRFMQGGRDMSLFAPEGNGNDEGRRDELPTAAATADTSALGALSRARTPIEKLN